VSEEQPVLELSSTGAARTIRSLQQLPPPRKEKKGRYGGLFLW